MLQLLKKLFIGNSEKNDWPTLIKNGAIILDVRSVEEFKSGHLSGAINIPLQVLATKINQLNKHKTIIACCASGMRSAAAKKLLESKGFMNVLNGGGWYSLQQKINA
jgi:phage shock protein E